MGNIENGTKIPKESGEKKEIYKDNFKNGTKNVVVFGEISGKIGKENLKKGKRFYRRFVADSSGHLS